MNTTSAGVILSFVMKVFIFQIRSPTIPMNIADFFDTIRQPPYLRRPAISQLSAGIESRDTLRSSLGEINSVLKAVRQLPVSGGSWLRNQCCPSPQNVRTDQSRLAALADFPTSRGISVKFPRSPYHSRLRHCRCDEWDADYWKAV